MLRLEFQGEAYSQIAHGLETQLRARLGKIGIRIFVVDNSARQIGRDILVDLTLEGEGAHEVEAWVFVGEEEHVGGGQANVL